MDNTNSDKEVKYGIEPSEALAIIENEIEKSRVTRAFSLAIALTGLTIAVTLATIATLSSTYSFESLGSQIWLASLLTLTSAEISFVTSAEKKNLTRIKKTMFKEGSTTLEEDQTE